LKQKKAIISVCTSEPSLEQFLLTPTEWNILQQLDPIMAPFVEATEYFSQTKVPLLHAVIPMMDKLDTFLRDIANNAALHISVRHAAACAVAVLSKYYQKTDTSIIYRLTMLLHPRLKKAYFLAHNWLLEWIEEAIRLLRAWFRKHYKHRARLPMKPQPTKQNQRKRFFDDAFVDVDEQSVDMDELEAYLESPTVKDVVDPLEYWHKQRAAGISVNLAQMALDLLSAPATSVDVERLFSFSGNTITKLRNRLSADRSTATILVGSWARTGGILAEHEFRANLTARWRKRGEEATPADTVIVAD